MFDFIAIDFETANSKMSSACSVGIVAVENRKIVETFYSLINPEGQSFNPCNVSIHGITQDMVKGAPTLTELMPKLSLYFDEHIPVVAHNAHFDMSVLRSSTDAELPNFIFIDSMEIAEPLVMGSRSLDNCAKELSIAMNNHHNAAEDAEACAEIALKGMYSIGCLSMWEYIAKASNVRARDFAELKVQKSMSKHRNIKPADYAKWAKDKNTAVAPTIDTINENGALFGKNIVFTGELSIDRIEAKQIAVNAGAIIKTGVSKKVDYLVVGLQDKSLVGEDGLSTKEEKAYELNASGAANIVFLNEAQFLELAKSEVTV